AHHHPRRHQVPAVLRPRGVPPALRQDGAPAGPRRL
ncbi:MAG: hypothetical protein AVDCRST_MAG77-629, partial [uncultured Chloroflexi bacterium]